jgi:hypothetical protein
MEGTMKKIFILSMFLLLISGIAYAKTDIAESGKITNDMTPSGTLISSMSAHVGGQIMSGTTNYAIELKHISGTKNFGVSSADTKMYQYTIVNYKGQMKMEVDLTNSTSVDFMGSGWSTL